MRFTPDTNILARSHDRAKGPARRLMELVFDSPQHTLVLSRPMMAELRRVLAYPRLQAQHRMTSDEMERFVGVFERLGAFVEPPVVSPVVLSDPDDDVSCTRRWKAGPRSSARWTATSGSRACSPSAPPTTSVS